MSKLRGPYFIRYDTKYFSIIKWEKNERINSKTGKKMKEGNEKESKVRENTLKSQEKYPDRNWRVNNSD